VNRKSGSWCVYGTVQQPFWTDPNDKTRSWGVFANLGISDGNPNPVRWTGNVGVAGCSPIPDRKYDTFGVAYYYLGLTQSLKELAPRLLPLRDEQGVEVFYPVGMTPWFHITTDVQVINPVCSRVDTDLVVGLRAKIDW
jgi:porin